MQHLLSIGDSSVFFIRTSLHQYNFPISPFLAFAFLLAFTVLVQERKFANLGSFIGFDTLFARILPDWKALVFAM